MKKSLFSKALICIILCLPFSPAVFSQSWNLAGNSFTNPASDFIGTTDWAPLVFKTNNLTRVTLTDGTWGGFGGFEVGDGNLSSYINIHSQDIVGTLMPFSINGNVAGLTWGNSNGETIGRLVRFNQTDNISGWNNFYDLGIGQDLCFFITNHTVPPSFGNGVVRKRMIVISPEDMVGINLDGDNIGGGAVPTANFHSKGTARLENLPSGTGNIVVIDNSGNLYRSSSSARIGGTSATEFDELKAEVEKLKQELASMKELLSQKTGSIEVMEKSSLLQNAPNPFDRSTVIRYSLPSNYRQASLEIRDMSGKLVKNYSLTAQSRSTSIAAGELASGTYVYSLVVDGKKIDTKKMVLTK